MKSQWRAYVQQEVMHAADLELDPAQDYKFEHVVGQMVTALIATKHVASTRDELIVLLEKAQAADEDEGHFVYILLEEINLKSI